MRHRWSEDAGQVLNCVIWFKIRTHSDAVIRCRFDYLEVEGEILIISFRLNSVCFRGDQDRRCYPENTKNTASKFAVKNIIQTGSIGLPGHLCLGLVLSPGHRKWSGFDCGTRTNRESVCKVRKKLT